MGSCRGFCTLPEGRSQRIGPVRTVWGHACPMTQHQLLITAHQRAVRKNKNAKRLANKRVCRRAALAHDCTVIGTELKDTTVFGELVKRNVLRDSLMWWVLDFLTGPVPASITKRAACFWHDASCKIPSRGSGAASDLDPDRRLCKQGCRGVLTQPSQGASRTHDGWRA